jgi:hypothetical protein
VIVNEFRTLHDEVWFATASQVKRDGFELGPSRVIPTGKKGPEVDQGLKDAVRLIRKRVESSKPSEPGGAGLPLSIGKPAAGLTASVAARRMPGRPACSPA